MAGMVGARDEGAIKRSLSGSDDAAASLGFAMSNPHRGGPMSPDKKLRRTLAVLLAGGSLAIGVPAALAAGGDDAGSAGAAGSAAPSSGFVQDEQQRPQQPNGEDCPERGGDGNGNGGSGEDSSSGGATTSPAV
jgi:hypothetical protein